MQRKNLTRISQYIMLPKGLLKEYSRAISMMIRAMDMLTVFFAGYIASLLRFGGSFPHFYYIAASTIGALLTPIIFSFFSIYTSVRGHSFLKHILGLLQAICVLMLVLAGFAFFTKSGAIFSRIWFSAWMGSALFMLILLRFSVLFFLRFMRARGLNERHVVILGAGEQGALLAQTVTDALWTGFRIVTFMDDEAKNKPAFIHQIPVIETPENLSQYLSDAKIDEVWLALPLRSEERVKTLLHELRHLTISIRLILDIFGLDLFNHSVIELAGFPAVNLNSTPMMGINRLVKAIEDRMLAALILILISPLLLLIALFVKCTSKGPVLFKQKRNGCDGRVIKVYKFRTMIHQEEEEDKLTQAKADDERVTAFGKFLRRTSLDELPQFINVLQGRMSIVGPRPHAILHNEQYKELIEAYMQRHKVKPGITGWAQVNGWRGETETLEKMKKRIEYDLYYIENWSMGFDVKIIFLTFLRGFIHQNAY